MTLVVAVGLFMDYANRRILMQQRSPNRNYGGQWEMPGGKVEEGEDIRTALRREWKEELGLDIRVGRLVDELVLSFPGYPHTLLPLFEVRPAPRLQLPRPLDGQMAVRWVDLEELLSYSCVPSVALYYPAVERHMAGSTPGWS